jgi:hypothetical protein
MVLEYTPQVGSSARIGDLLFAGIVHREHFIRNILKNGLLRQPQQSNVHGEHFRTANQSRYSGWRGSVLWTNAKRRAYI